MKHTTSLIKKSSKLSIAFAFGIALIGATHLHTVKADTTIQVTDLTAQTPEQIVQSMTGGSIQVSHVHYTGSPSALGTFAGAQPVFGMDSGVVLSSGNVQGIVGPNRNDYYSADNQTAGDADLNVLLNGTATTNDASVLDFDFVSDTGYISLKYVFSSDEYSEFINSRYNDVFGFFLNGQNIALIPNTTTPVSINTVNGGNANNFYQGVNSQYFINNELSIGAPYNTEMDGFTTVLTAVAKVDKGVLNHIKIAIGDAGDNIIDSNVLIQLGSFTDDTSGFSVTPSTPDLSTTPVVDSTSTNSNPVPESPVVTTDPTPVPDSPVVIEEPAPVPESPVVVEPAPVPNPPVVVQPAPVPQPEKIVFDKFTGGGKLVPYKNMGLNSNFGFNIQNTASGVIADLEFNDNSKLAGVPKKVHITGIVSNVKQKFDASGHVIGIQFNAEASIDKTTGTVHVVIVDKGSIEDDIFMLSVLDGDYMGYKSGDGNIAQGNIKSH